MTANFANISAYEQKLEARPFIFVQIVNEDGSSPTLFCKPCTEANPPFYNEYLRVVTERRKAGRKAKEATRDLVKAQRDEDRELIGKFGTSGWAHVVDASGNEVEFSQEESVAFLSALPDWLFDEYRHWAQNPANFTSASVVDEKDAEALGN